MTPAEPHPTVCRFDELAARILGRIAQLGGTRMVAIDGGTGSGKSMFAARLAAAVTTAGASVVQVHIDDLLDGWDDQFEYWPRLDAAVLEPLRNGRPGRYRRFDWTAGRFSDQTVTVEPAGVMLLDGVATAGRQAQGALSYSLFLDAPAQVRRVRVVERDGAGVADHLLVWMAREVTYFAHNEVAARADERVDGAPQLVHDPGTQYVRLS